MRINPQNIHRIFDLSIIVKGVDGLLEVVGGILFLFITPQSLNGIVAFLFAHELSEDPHDWLAASLNQTVLHLTSNTKLFAGIYLIFHEFIKIFPVAGLLQKNVVISGGNRISQPFHPLSNLPLFQFAFH